MTLLSACVDGKLALVKKYLLRDPTSNKDYVFAFNVAFSDGHLPICKWIWSVKPEIARMLTHDYNSHETVMCYARMLYKACIQEHDKLVKWWMSVFRNDESEKWVFQNSITEDYLQRNNTESNILRLIKLMHSCRPTIINHITDQLFIRIYTERSQHCMVLQWFAMMLPDKYEVTVHDFLIQSYRIKRPTLCVPNLEECFICNVGECKIQAGCGHQLCEACYDALKCKTCPFCRAPLADLVQLMCAH